MENLSQDVVARHLDCRVCGKTGLFTEHEAKEMFLGTRDRFIYHECHACGSLQLHQVPDLDAYYEHPEYVPLAPIGPHDTSAVERLLRRLVTSWRLRFGRDRGHWTYPLRLAEASLDSRVLDVGCGAGTDLWLMERSGFRHLIGIDPHTASSGGRVTIINCTLDEFDGGPFDIIMMNDSLEHVPNPVLTLTQARRLLRSGGKVIVRIPVLGFAWRKYGTNWVQLDAPRHLHVPSVTGVYRLASRADFTVTHSFHDSTAFQFFGSELYQRGVSLNKSGTLSFPDDQLRMWERDAVALNKRGDGDHATFILSHERIREQSVILASTRPKRSIGL